MPQRLRPRPNRRARLGLSVLLLAVAAAVTSPVAAADRGRLDHPTVLPAQGTTATPFTFTVRYRDGAGIAAQVFVNVGGAWRAMTPTSTYWRVLCPDGREGWVHRMTLGEVVGEDAPPSPVETWSIPPELLARLEPPRAPEPEPALFSAFLAARRADA